MGLSELPTELIYMIADVLDSQHAINAFARTDRALFARLNPYLYRYHVKHSVPSSALMWAAERGDSELLKRLLSAGVDIYNPYEWDNLDTGFKFCHLGYDHPIIEASYSGHVEFVETMLDTGMIDKLSKIDRRFLSLTAIWGKRENVVDMLFRRGLTSSTYAECTARPKFRKRRRSTRYQDSM
ncbi:hypothetical protein BO78DRAFT_395250 [Aspergillus sclerotiicarbonarius CBS 121057]|uniref:Ankyrin n=1 Tax=Aspergillus sclerotiicarbonarius (strain CBS 121057 / IBT 28362) TaxID=1448318 RepID=A0A319FL39_ASPSB|nr:hypothetical protein BO78DRAFT_395250 [Aspergillus sclerotiicarbonarius CBS 121057]